MAQLTTYSEMRTKLLNDYDINDLNFVTETELIGYINEAIDDSETAIHTMNWEDKYFLTSYQFPWVAGTSSYSPPTDIYGNKVRLIQYVSGATVYPITRIQRLEDLPFINPADPYQYLITNDATLGYQYTFYPPVAETSSNATLWYIRNMRRVTSSLLSANVCEIPECVNFVYAHVKWNLSKKTRRPELIAIEDANRQLQYGLMMDALKDMTAETNNLAFQDLSSYFDQGGWR